MTAGLRERKKQQTRDRIAAIATELFLHRGFERSTIAEVAAAADVAKMTVTNYFPLKEDLVFDRQDEMIQMPVGAVAGRAAGQGIAEAIEAEYLAQATARNPTLGFVGRDFARMVAASPALLAREREIFARQEEALAEAIATDLANSPADLRPRLAAAQLSGALRVLYGEGRRRLLAGEDTAGIVRALRRAAPTAFGIVSAGLPAAYRSSVPPVRHRSAVGK